MRINGRKYDSIIIKSQNKNARIVTANDGKKVIAIISEGELVIKISYEVEMVPASEID